MRKLRYQIYIKAKNSWSIVLKGSFSEEVTPSCENLAFMAPLGSSKMTDDLKKFYSNKFKVQHVIRGSLSLGGFNHEVIKLVEASGDHACIGLGVVDQLFWIRQARFPGSRVRSVNVNYFAFPTSDG